MTKWGMVIDISKCTGCYNCFIACKDEYWDNDYPPYSAAQPKHGQFWINIDTKERGSHPFIKVAHIPFFAFTVTMLHALRLLMTVPFTNDQTES